MANVGNTKKNKHEQIVTNVRIIILIMAILFAAITLRLWYLQIVQGEHYSQKSKDNRIRTRRVRSLRGIITDRNGEILADNSLAFNLQLVPENIDQIDDIANLLSAQIDDLAAETIINLYHKPPTGVRHRPLTLKKNLNPNELARVEARKRELPGILIETEPIREYPYDEICSHIIGYLGFINDRELGLLAYKSYARDDLVGRTGIEAQYQNYLRGQDGRRQVIVNARGRELSNHTIQLAQSGKNLQLTIDINLQQHAFELMDTKVGSLIAINPENGEILALISAPSFSNNLFSTRISAKDWQKINNDPLKPLQNRPIQGRYPPGSVIKPLIAALALTDHVITPQTSFTCSGAMTLGSARFRCWNRYGHGKVKLQRSLKESCDVYYYNLATRIAIDRIADFGADFGLGRLSGIELPGEKSGLLPSSSWKLKNVHDQWYTGDTISVCIGQGYLTTTPLQIAAMYSVFANGGIYYRPHLIKEKSEPSTANNPQESASKFVGSRVETSDHHMQIIRKALWQVVNDKRGTAFKSRITIKGWEMAGKTGTAQVIKQNLEDLKSKKEIPWRFRDHAWFAAFAPYNDPKIAVAILIEHGGHGGSTAAPIARRVIEYYLDTLK